MFADKFENKDFKVQVRCLTFNHSAYIIDALNGVCMQQTNFPFVYIIIDDASTDGEQEMINLFLHENFDIKDNTISTEETDDYRLIFTQHKTNKNCYFGVFFLKYNHYSIRKHKAPYLPMWLKKVPYIAICEGDDYWTDPYKLQKQVDFLEDHPDFVICSHDYIKYYQNCQSFANNTYYHKLFAKFPQNEYIEYTLDNYFERWWTQPLTYVYRNGQYLDKIPRQKYKYFRDSVLAYYILKEGKGALMPFLGGVYRIQDGGIWAGKEMAYNHWVAVKNAYDIFSIEGDKRALLQCHRSEYYRIYALKKEKKYKELFFDIFHYFHIMPIDYSWKLFQQLLSDKIRFWKTKINCIKQ